MRLKKRNLSSLIGLAIILILGPAVYFGLIKPHKIVAAWPPALRAVLRIYDSIESEIGPEGLMTPGITEKQSILPILPVTVKINL